ncbi:MAG: membrane protein insertion efficiency factor YidD [Verrucomicrobiota bacterium]
MHKMQLNKQRGFLATPLVWFAVFLIRAYQLLISPLKYAIFGPSSGCRFYPTCSCYAHQAYEKYGFLRGSALTIKRIARCHPWNPGGYDPLPDHGPKPQQCGHDNLQTQIDG